MSDRLPGDPAADPRLPPVVLYLPAIRTSARNSAARVAELIAIKASRGPGTYVAQEVASPSAYLVEGRRISEVGGGPVLDLYTVDYHQRLNLPDDTGTSTSNVLRRFGTAFGQFCAALLILVSASRRAKSTVAKWQLVLGLGVVVLLFLSAVFTALAVLVALGLWTEPDVPERVGDAIALGGTAFTTWLFFRVRPATQEGTKLLARMLTYAHDERHASGVTGVVDSALDDLLERQPGRTVHIVGYSLGALVAVDFSFPRRSLGLPVDKRHGEAIATLVTVGCPLDFVRLYFPSYTDDRMARVPGLPWTNIYIPADVLASNLVDGDDYAAGAGEIPSPGGRKQPATLTTIADARPVCHRYTNQRLTYRNIWMRQGLLSHGGYWDEPERENCLHLVMRQICPQMLADAPPLDGHVRVGEPPLPR
jgi:hypothetical protein